MKPWLAYLFATLVVTITALLPSNVMSSTKSTWYDCIKPSITPPNFVFPIVWSILYIMIAIALAQTLLLPSSTTRNLLLVVFGVNLLLNVLWSYAYFGWRNMLLSMAIIIILWATIIIIVVQSFKVHPKWVGYILLPYLFWVSFATILNGISLSKASECAML